jgi:maltooligosyltrehalose synthase
MPRTKLGQPKPRLEQLLQPQQTTVQIQGTALETALVAALQPLYREIADLKQAQATSNTALRSLTERIRSQESALTAVAQAVADLLSNKPSSAAESQLQLLLSQLLQTSSSLSALASRLPTLLQRHPQLPPAP